MELIINVLYKKIHKYTIGILDKQDRRTYIHRNNLFQDTWILYVHKFSINLQACMYSCSRCINIIYIEKIRLSVREKVKERDGYKLSILLKDVMRCNIIDKPKSPVES